MVHVLLQDVRDNKAEAASAAPQALRLCRMVRFMTGCNKRQTCLCYAIWCCCPLAAMAAQPVTARFCLPSFDYGRKFHVLLLEVSRIDCFENPTCFGIMTCPGIWGSARVDRPRIACQCHFSGKYGRLQCMAN